jgi:hypothetical protein
MGMLIWGSRGESKDLGPIETRACPTCEKDRPFHLYVNYRLHHIWYLLKWVTQKQYMQLCEVCRRGTEVEKASPLLAKAKGAIPAYHRYSWAILPALFVPIVGVGMMANNDEAARTVELIAAPRPGDTYAVDMSKVLKDGEQKFKYGIVRIKAINGSAIEFQLPKISYNKLTGATGDLGSRANADDYYGTSGLQIPKVDLQQLQDSGAIYRIRRQSLTGAPKAP